MTSFESQPLHQQQQPQSSNGTASPLINVARVLFTLWEQWREWEQDLAVYCQSSPARLALGTGVTLGVLLIALYLFWRLRLF